MNYWWLSFADPHKPKGEQFLGVAVIDADRHRGEFRAPIKIADTSFAKAIARAHALGANPGGEVQGSLLPELNQAQMEILVSYEDRLLTMQEATALDQKLGEARAVDIGLDSGTGAGTPLLIGPREKTKLANLRARAAKHPVEMFGLLERLQQPQEKQQHMKQMSRQTVYLPAAYAVTLSIETGHPIGTCRHMSMSVKTAGRVPNQYALWMVAEELGFVGSLEECRIWLEDLEGHGKAVNVVQPLNMQETGKE